MTMAPRELLLVAWRGAARAGGRVARDSAHRLGGVPGRPQGSGSVMVSPDDPPEG
jgi:hypothetical protein